MCLKCKKPRHMVNESPLNSKHKNFGVVMRKPERVYSWITKSQGANNLSVGTWHLFYEPIFVMFDTGATHPFISPNCVQLLNLDLTPLPTSMRRTTSNDGSVETFLAV